MRSRSAHAIVSTVVRSATPTRSIRQPSMRCCSTPRPNGRGECAILWPLPTERSFPSSLPMATARTIPRGSSSSEPSRSTRRRREATPRSCRCPKIARGRRVRYFDAATIRACLPWPRMLAALDAMLKEDVAAPLRANHAIDVPAGPPATLLLMPAWRTGKRIGVKLVTVFPGNRDRGERAVNAVYALFDATNGVPLALFDGDEITARRTAGASAYAARFLARRDAKHLVMVGAGRQARGLIESHCHVRPIERVSLWSRTPAHAEAAGRGMRKDGLPVAAVPDLETVVRSADIVCCATLATAPLVQGKWLAPGVHLDLVGAFRPEMRETDDAAIARADVIVVDDRPGALAEGGDLVQALASGAIGADRIVATLGDFAHGLHRGRTRDDEVTVFKSVGFALEDIAAAEAVLDSQGTG